ncbi:cupin domain-containing protein [Burkholderia sp. L27(2015)]|uniref:cupin domain-containing protein n=1 Tax=Burkholderia sp. L27(2015) TaxID=1641858 RepID=UPI00131D486C|nr:cupin domain-containing protein [Burkholderia sp. L27(2015)]
MDLTTTADPVELLEAFDTVHAHWSPKVVAQVNDQYVKIAKLFGQLVWHNHEHEDELFYVVRGELRMEYEGGRTVNLREGSLHVVPRGVMHNPVAESECWIVLIESVTTKHTGDVVSPLTKSLDEQLY